jgi:hypothetical protein
VDDPPPISERFRELSDELLLTTLDGLRVPVHVVRGTPAQRLARVADLAGLTPRIDLEEALQSAR